MQTAWHEVITRALRGALGQHRRFDLQKTLLIKVGTGAMRNAVPQHQVALHAGAAQIEITVFEADGFVCLAVVLHIDGRRFARA